MGEQTGTTRRAPRSSGGVFTRGFLPGLVLGIVIGAVLVFISAELIGKTPRFEPDPNATPASAGERDERGEMGEEMIEEQTDEEPPAPSPEPSPETPEDDG